MSQFMESQATRPHVLIVGAGLAGLTLAQSLRKQGISFDIFERDGNIDARAGGILNRLKHTLPSDVPDLETVNHLRLLELVPQLCFYGGPTKAFVQSTEDTPVLRANRQQLRKLLSTGIDVHWGARITEVQQSADGVGIVLADGSTYHGDVLVGADGVQSVVRSHILPSAQPSTLPAGVINGELQLTGEEFRRQLELGNSAYVAGADGFHLYVGLSNVIPDASGGNYYWFLNFYDPEAADEPYWTASASKEQMRYFALEKTKALHPRFAEIVRLTPEEGIRSRQIVFRDLLIDGIPEGRITLIGDAAHPMAPFRGEGGSNALQDALNLGDALAKANKEGVPCVLKAYEEEMLPRGRGAVSRSRAVLDPKNGARSTFAWGQDFKFEDLPEDLR